MRELRAIYYPYSRCLNADTLKRIALLFDKVWFIDPFGEEGEQRLKDTGMFETQYAPLDPWVLLSEWESVKQFYAPLCEIGLLESYGVHELVADHDALIGLATYSDINDVDFLRICRNAEQKINAWYVSGGRIPRSLSGFVQHVMTKSSSSYDFDFDSWWDKQPDFLSNSLGQEKGLVRFYHFGDPGDLKELEVKRLVEIDEAKIQQIFEGSDFEDTSEPLTVPPGQLPLPGFKVSNKRDDFPLWAEGKYRFFGLSYTIGSSLFLNQSLLISEELGVPLLTDSPLHYRLLQLKYKRAREAAAHIDHLRMPYTRQKPVDLQSLNSLALAALYSVIPPPKMATLSLNDIVEIRNKLAPEISSFKEMLAELVVEIEAHPWSDEYEAEVSNVVESKLLPEVRKLRENLKISKKELTLDLAKNLMLKGAATITPTLVASVLAGLSPGEILTMGCAAAVGAVGLTSENLFNYWKKRRELRSNSVGFLVRLTDD